MNPDQLSDAELDELLGAYALNAVDETEREAVDRYLARSPRARAEVADHLLVAAALGSSPAESPMPLWDRISGQLLDRLEPVAAEPTATVEPTAQVVPISSARGRRRQPRFIGFVASAAAAVAVVGVLGVSMSRNGGELDDLRVQLATAETRLSEAQKVNSASLTVESLIAAPGTRIAQLTAEGGSTALAKVIIGRDGRGFLVNDNPMAIPNGEVLQLWGVQDKQVISLGVMFNGTTAMPLSAAGEWSQFVLTSEALPGVVTSDGPALAAGVFSV
jgi:Anti-sigma-K factor rskA